MQINISRSLPVLLIFWRKPLKQRPLTGFKIRDWQLLWGKEKHAKLSISEDKYENVCLMLRKCAQSWYGLRKCAQSIKQRTYNKVCQKMRRYEKVCQNFFSAKVPINVDMQNNFLLQHVLAFSKKYTAFGAQKTNNLIAPYQQFSRKQP